ncbi:DUF4367 domain-containing protein [Dorea sp. OM02-2LB]|nr:DUF4367 domain-containing protein [Dorea sp. OM02-2LB]
MKEIQKLSFEEELQREADAIEKELEADPDLKELELPEDFDRKMEERLRAIEKERFAQNTRVEKQEERQEEYESRLSEKDREALELGRKMLEQKKRSHRRIPRKAKVWLPLAASMILVLACGITSVGSKSYWKNLWKRMLGEQKNTVINVEDMDTIKSEEQPGDEAYHNIDKTLHVNVVRIVKGLKKMRIVNYEVDEQQKLAKIFYDYNGKTLLYGIYLNDEDSSYSEKVADPLTDEFDVTNEKQTIHVMEYQIRGTEEYRYVTNFEYQGIHYRLKGIMKRSDFEEILKNLYYF